MNKLLLYILLISAPTMLKAQRSYETNPDRKRTYNWLFGDSIWLDFRENPPLQRTGSQLKALEAMASHSDTGGNLLLYTNGLTIWHKNHKIISNGSSLTGHESSSQGALFIPQPGNDSIVYLFTTDYQGQNKGFCYNKIVLRENIDSSILIEKNIKLLPSVCESISATKHANGRWVWVVAHNASGKGLNAFLITESGINHCPVYSEGDYVFDGERINCQSTSAFNHTGNTYVICALVDFVVEFLEFDNKQGKFKPLNKLYNIWIPAAISFTAEDKYCYIAQREKKIIRVDYHNWSIQDVFNIEDSFMVVDSYNTPYGEILFNIFDTTFIGGIDDPENPNPLFIKKFILFDKKATNGLPNFNNSYFYTPSVDYWYHYDCRKNSVSFEGKDTFEANLHRWQLKKKSASGWLIIGNTKVLNHVFSDTGVYHVRYIASKGSRSDTIIKEIDIHPKLPSSFLGNDTALVLGSSYKIKLKTPPGMQCIRWQDGSSSDSFVTTAPGSYICQVTSPAFCQFSDTIVISECADVLQQPYISQHKDTLKVSYTGADSFVWFHNNTFFKATSLPYIKLQQIGFFKVVAVKNGYCSRSSDTISVRVLNGIITPQVLHVSLFPQPFSQNFHLTFQERESFIVELYSLEGKLLFTEYLLDTKDVTIQPPAIAEGLYMIKITTSDHRQLIQPIIKQ